MTKRRRVLVAALAAGAALPIAGWALLQTGRARTALREWIVAAVESSIQGELEIASARVEPTLAVRIDRVRLLAPDGAVAATSESVRLRVDVSSLWKRHPVVVLSATRPDLDLTPAEDGSTALSRALEPDVPATADEGPRVSLVVFLRGGSVIRGPPPGSPEGALLVRAERVSLDGTVELFPRGVQAWLSATTRLREPRDESMTLRVRLDTTGGAIGVDRLRVAIGGSRAHGSAIRIEPATGGGFMLPEGMLRGRIRAADFARWTGRSLPGDLHVEASSHGGTAIVAASVDDGGQLFGTARRNGGTWTGSIVARDVPASAWGLDGVDGPAGAVLSFDLRPSDRAWGLHARTSPFAWRGARFEPVVATARGRGTGEIRATVERFAVTQDGRRWVLARPATFARRPGGFEVRHLALAGPHGQTLTADGAWPPSKPAPLAITARALALEEIPLALLPASARPRGRLDLVARLDAAPRAGDVIPDGRVSLRLRHARPGIAAASPYLPRGDLDVVANAVLAGRRARLTLDARASSGESLRATADAPLRVPRANDHGFVDLRGSGFATGGLLAVGGRLRAGFSHRRLWFLVHAESGEREIVRAGGAGTADLDALLRERRLPAFAAWVERVDGAALSTAGLLPAGVTGTLRGGVTSDGSASFAAVSASGVRWSSWLDASFTAAAQASGRLATASLRVTTAREGVARREHGAVGVTARLHPGAGEIAASGQRAQRFAVRGVLQDVRLAEAVTKRVPEAMRTVPDADGRVDAAIVLDGGNGEAPSGWAWLSAHDLAVEGVAAGRIDALAHLREAHVAATVSARGPDGGRLAALARVGPWGTAPLLQAPLVAVAAADDFDLASLAGFFRQHATGVAGTLRLRGVAAGTLGRPVPRARIDLSGGALRTRDLGRLRAIAIAASLTPDELFVESLEARGPRGGSLVAQLRARLAAMPSRSRVGQPAPRERTDSGGWRIEGQAKARNFTVQGERFDGAFDGSARVTGRLDRAGGASDPARIHHPLLVARVDVDEGTIHLPDVPEKTVQTLDEHPDFVVVTGDSEERVVVAGRRSPGATRLRTKLHLIATENLRVTGRDVDLLLSADVKLDTGAEDGTAYEGEVRALRGSAAVAGKKFTLEHARIGFPGAPVAKARLDIAADHVVEATGPDEEATVVHARVRGTVEEPNVELTSDPPMPEDAVASMLFLGAARRPGRPDGTGDGPSLAGRAATLLGNYLTAKLRDQVQQVVPVDVLELETGRSGSSEGRLRVGKYLAPGLFLSYSRSFGGTEDEGVNNVRLEWRLRRRWQVVSEITDGNRGHVDLVWTREF